jgi:hypothetical protein
VGENYPNMPVCERTMGVEHPLNGEDITQTKQEHDHPFLLLGKNDLSICVIK